MPRPRNFQPQPPPRLRRDHQLTTLRPVDQELSSLAPAFKLDWRAKNRKPYTIEHYLKIVRLYESWAKDNGAATTVDELSATDIKRWLVSLQDDYKLAAHTIRNYYTHLRGFVTWALKHEGIEESPFTDVPKPKTPKLSKPYLTQEEVFQVIAAAEGPWKARDQAIVCLMFDTGMRLTEVASIQLQDIDWEKQFIFLPDTKTGEEVQVHFNDKTFRYLRAYLDSLNFDPEPWLWWGKYGTLSSNGIHQAIKRLVKKAGITKNITAHSLRHSFATNLVMAGIDRGDLKELGRWSSWTMVEHYSHQAAKARAVVAHKEFSLVDRAPRRRQLR